MFLTQVVSCFLLWTILNIKVPLLLRIDRKWIGRVGYNCKRTLNIEFEQDWSVGLGATLGDATDRKLKIIFLASRIFSGKADSVILLGFERTINPQVLMKIVWAIFEKMKIFNFFHMWTTLNFDGRSRTRKETGDILKGTLDIEFERDWSVNLGATLGGGQKIKNYFSSFRNFSGKSR